MLVSLIAHPVPLLAWAILIVGRVLLGIGESFILTGNLTWGMWLAGSTHAGQVISWNGMATYGALTIGAPLGLSLYARAGLALPALLVVLLPIIASGVIYGIPGNIPTARPRVPVLRVVGLVWRPGTGLVLQGIGFATLSAFTALWFNERHWDNTGFAITLFGIAFIAVRFFCAKFPDRYGAPRSQPFHYW